MNGERDAGMGKCKECGCIAPSARFAIEVVLRERDMLRARVKELEVALGSVCPTSLPADDEDHACISLLHHLGDLREAARVLRKRHGGV